ncbi:hypothetical protein SISSUDRAFT_453303 [Sistotremastrum suecicum HHB10207 ss-3]|uniref:Uncharacterized protein n=1 Tax=Sistotremastrum suecicum HHB10207 ss-3 TaxID=1314776 RepID=A0A165Y9D6_9AGAM|nr:hypothetical protein SISSUDRAFT_453303 [Sistotremastrum suecicum HHB10207 ss-3]
MRFSTTVIYSTFILQAIVFATPLPASQSKSSCDEQRPACLEDTSSQDTYAVQRPHRRNGVDRDSVFRLGSVAVSQAAAISGFEVSSTHTAATTTSVEPSRTQNSILQSASAGGQDPGSALADDAEREKLLEHIIDRGLLSGDHDNNGSDRDHSLWTGLLSDVEGHV